MVNTRNRVASHAGQLMVDSNTLRLGLIAATDCRKSLSINNQSQTSQQARKGSRMPLIYQEVSCIADNFPVLFSGFSL
jgi:hypothetical protein